MAANDSKNVKNDQDNWLIRPCDDYKDEYDECTSIKARFHQYFIFGEILDCNSWKKDYNNCCKWENSNDDKAAKEIIQSEKKRRIERLRPHYRNDVWNRRTSPPEDWNKPLPDYMQKQYENSFLQSKAEEIKINGVIDDPKANRTFCVIS